jgi:hypothetical protein
MVNSVVVVLPAKYMRIILPYAAIFKPKMIAPASRRIATGAASMLGLLSSYKADPKRVGMSVHDEPSDCGAEQ